MEALKLKVVEIESITNRLCELANANAEVPSLAYAVSVDNSRGCGCKGSCDSGCTSW